MEKIKKGEKDIYRDFNILTIFGKVYPHHVLGDHHHGKGNGHGHGHGHGGEDNDESDGGNFGFKLRYFQTTC